MKSLQNLNNVERAKLLFELFPESIPGFITYVKEATANYDKEDLRKTWSNGMIGVDWWISLLDDVQAILIKYGSSISKSKNLFSDQLFDGYNAFVTSTLLSNYANKSGIDKKFTAMVKILFEF